MNKRLGTWYRRYRVRKGTWHGWWSQCWRLWWPFYVGFKHSETLDEAREEVTKHANGHREMTKQYL